MYDPLSFAIPESIDYKDHLVATYLYEAEAGIDALQAARSIVETQSAGTWVSVAGATDEIRHRCHNPVGVRGRSIHAGLPRVFPPAAGQIMLLSVHDLAKRTPTHLAGDRPDHPDSRIDGSVEL
jgi:hypothetical protein